MTWSRVGFLSLVILLPGAGGASAESLPPITHSERDLKVAPNEPSAPAVFLIQRGVIHLRNYEFRESSIIGVQARIKILKEEGKSRGEIAIPHSGFVHLSKFEGRTITPDGRVVKVDSKGKFKRKVSEATGRSVSSIAFPAVEVGAILDYEYELTFDSFYFLEPWYFMDELPVLKSEVIWEVPFQLESRVWMVGTFGVEIVQETQRRVRHTEARFSAKNLPSTPREAYGYPFRDQAARMMVVPMVYKDQGFDFPLLDSWASVCEALDKVYVEVRKSATLVAAKALTLSAGKPRDEFAIAAYRFVRDGIKNTSGEGPWIEAQTSVDKILTQAEGSSAEKALLLQALLRAVDLDSQLIWVADRTRGAVVPDLPNPSQFDRVLVRYTNTLGQSVTFDPVDQSLAPDRLSQNYEGTLALVHDAKKPETITLPITSFAAHHKRAVLTLDVDSEGRTSGKGSLMLRGHYAWEKSVPGREAKATEEAWQKWATAAMPGFTISGIKVDDNPDEATLKVEWSMAATEETVLGDEVTLNPARPIGPVKQPFPVNEVERRSPIMMAHGGIEEVELKLTWPKGWSLVAPPQAASSEARIAAYRVEASVDAATNTLSFKRSLQIRKREPADRTEFAALRNLYAEAEKRDAQTLVLARR